MKQLNWSLGFWPPLVAVSVAMLLSACSKKAEAPASPSGDAQATTAAAPSSEAQAPDAQQAPSGPVLDASQMAGNAKQAMADADAAFRQREYEKAVRTMLAIQQAQLNAQQAEAARQQMITLQRNLAAAVASGDPNAAAAAQILRAGRSH
jgi:hypothetical protein